MSRSFRPRGPKPGPGKSQEEIDAIVRRLKSEQAAPENYREKSLKLHGWICAKCGREFELGNLHLLTVHHKDGNHHNNPPDGSNWENLCVYCHDDEHSQRPEDPQLGQRYPLKPHTSPSRCRRCDRWGQQVGPGRQQQHDDEEPDDRRTGA